MLTINNLKKRYGSKEVLQGVELQIEKGEILGFVGSNGAGKTTTLNSITGILEPDEGMVTINGISKLNRLIYKKQFFYIPDTINVFKNISGYDWIHFVLKLYDNKQTGKLNEFVRNFDMDEAIHNPMGSYSYGMMHKMSLIAAFTINPPIIIMDEPLNGLDPTAVLMFKLLLKAYVEEGGTVFFSTHLLDIAEKICSTVAILKDGKIVLHEDINNVIGECTLESFFMEKQANEA
ncbi:ABC transporter ATP-binding protein [Psychrobacillus lasiicapitis]|uniref:ABC transporter ATP-binding protein n=1 Tax=Psychrobacillus lasiicapitis TaxID=1636719 RepID=UPI001476CFB2|nr:ABC transporter ATP-binding protein [Psychrobacillus lasiicapitis]GGA38256.1 ABC transporter [Psychrobacillus lasiicapitis]